ncbi:MAG: hypothetical protein J6T40_02415 [Clostridiales bacterium]|nr:hypothetical protein [Clostridiales bacterium]
MKKGTLLAAAASFGIAACIGAGLLSPAKTVQAASSKATSVAINATNFPNATFREYVKQFDTDKNGAFSASEIWDVRTIELYKDTSVTSLKGIEYFTYLEKLSCGYNALTSLDVSKNTYLVYLECTANQISSLNVSNNPNLQTLLCRENKLTSLNLKNNIFLYVLACGANNISSLDVSINTNLNFLDCDNLSITSLNTSKNTDLETLICRGCKNLKSLDLRNNVNLVDLSASNSGLNSLDISKCRRLYRLYTDGTNISTIDITFCPKLLAIYYNGVKFEVSESISWLANEAEGKITGDLDAPGSAYYLTVNPNTTIKAKPSSVTGLTASPAGKNAVKLSWKSAGHVDGYLIYGQKNGKYSFVGMTTTGTTFTDTKALSENYNFYWVFGYVKDSNNNMHAGSCEKYKYAKGMCPSVGSLKASSVKGGVKLTWDASAGAEGYLIYGIVDGKPYKYISMTKGTSFTDKNASSTQYNYYWVFPYFTNSNGKMIVTSSGKYTYGRALK